MNTRDPGADTATTSHVQDPDDDAPTQPITPTSKELLDERRTRAIETIFGLDEEAIPSWPGLQLVCAHIESCFDVLFKTKTKFNAEFNKNWKDTGGNELMLGESCEVWDWCLAFLDVDFDKSLITNISKFAALCCVSLVLKPYSSIFGSVQFENYVSHDRVAYSVHSNEDSLLQEIRDSFKIAGVLNTDVHREDQSHDIERAGIDGDTGMIYENTVNFDSLSRLGRLTVEWVDDIANHLAFDQARHDVCIFRFPTFSAAMIEGYLERGAVQHW